MGNANGDVWDDRAGGYTRRGNAKSVFFGSGSEIAALDPVTPTSRYAFAGNGNDSVGSNNLTANGTPTYGTDGGVYGQYVILNGSSQYFTASANTVFDVTTGDFSLWGFIYRTSDSGGAETVVRKYTATGVGYYVRISSADQLEANIGVGGTDRTANTTATISLNTWYFWAVSFDRDGNLVIYLYNMGSGAYETATIAISATSASITNTDTFTVGRSSAAAANYFPGRIDHLNILLGTAITSAQVEDIIANLHGGQLAVCHGTGSGFTAGIVYKRNEENTAWESLVDTTETQTISGAKTFSAQTIFTDSALFNSSAYIDQLDSVRGRNDNGNLSIYAGSVNTGNIKIFTRNSGVDVERLRLHGNAAQGQAGIDCYEPISFAHALAGIKDPRLFLRSRKIYTVMSTSDVDADVSTGETLNNMYPGIVPSALSIGDYVIASHNQNIARITRAQKWEMMFFVDDILGSMADLEFEVGLSSNSDRTSLNVSTEHFACFRRDTSADVSYHCLTSGGSAITDTDTNITPAEGDVLTIESDETDIKFYVNGTLVATHTTNLPGTGTNTGFRMANIAEASSAGRIGGSAIILADRA